MDWKAKAIEMRQEAWQELCALPAFVAFRAADKMVVDLGGTSMLGEAAIATQKASALAVNKVRLEAVYASGPRPFTASTGDIAFEVINTKGTPMSTLPLMELCKDQGAKIGGRDPVNNFRSSLSRDARFYSFRHESGYYWWLTGVPVPNHWLEATEPDLLKPSVASSADN